MIDCARMQGPCGRMANGFRLSPEMTGCSLPEAAAQSASKFLVNP
jgi:hypothetical protein